MVVIGLIGPIAAGKSVVLAEMERLGAVAIRADDVSREVLAPGTELLAAVIDEFGEQYLRPDGSLDRRALGRVVFRDRSALDRLERMVHPAMVARMAERIAAERERAERPPAIAIEAANLVQMGALGLVDATVMVTAPREQCVARLMARDGVGRQYAEGLVALQDELGLGDFRADREIRAEGDEQATRQAAQRLWGQLVKAGR